MITEGTNLLLQTMSAFWGSSDWRYQFALADNICLLELIWVAIGHLDELQKAEKYPIRWTL